VERGLDHPLGVSDQVGAELRIPQIELVVGDAVQGGIEQAGRQNAAFD
jgi:hypothetical protein